MPVVKTQMAYFAGKPFKKVYSVDAKTGQFYMKLPGELVRLLNISDRVTADKLNELDRQWEALVRQYTSLQTTARKVIIYQYGATASIYEKSSKPAEPIDPEDEPNEHPSAWAPTIFERDDISFVDGEALSLAVAVFTEHTVHLLDDKQRYRYEFCRSSIPYGAYARELTSRFNPTDADHDSSLIEWTPEREAFFASLVLALEGLIMKLHDLTSNKTKLLAAANRGATGNLLEHK